MGAVFSNMNGKDSSRVLAFIDEYNRLQMSVEGEDIWRSGTPVGGSNMTLEQETGQVTSRVMRTAFYKIEPTHSPSTSTATAWTRSLFRRPSVKEGLLAIIFKGPAGFRLQSIDTGLRVRSPRWEASRPTTRRQPTIIATVVRYKNILKTGAETQVIMTVPQE